MPGSVPLDLFLVCHLVLSLFSISTQQFACFRSGIFYEEFLLHPYVQNLTQSLQIHPASSILRNS